MSITILRKITEVEGHMIWFINYGVPIKYLFLRVESETVSYSSQYPWMFGVLSVLIATGQHPLGDYPAKYEESQKVRYRSHHIQALPDPDKVGNGWIPHIYLLRSSMQDCTLCSSTGTSILGGGG